MHYLIGRLIGFTTLLTDCASSSCFYSRVTFYEIFEIIFFFWNFVVAAKHLKNLWKKEELTYVQFFLRNHMKNAIKVMIKKYYSFIFILVLWFIKNYFTYFLLFTTRKLFLLKNSVLFI